MDSLASLGRAQSSYNSFGRYFLYGIGMIMVFFGIKQFFATYSSQTKTKEEQEKRVNDMKGLAFLTLFGLILIACGYLSGRQNTMIQQNETAAQLQGASTVLDTLGKYIK